MITKRPSIRQTTMLRRALEALEGANLMEIWEDGGTCVHCHGSDKHRSDCRAVQAEKDLRLVLSTGGCLG